MNQFEWSNVCHDWHDHLSNSHLRERTQLFGKQYNIMRGFSAQGFCCLKHVKSEMRDFFSCRICVRALLKMAQQGTVVDQHCEECRAIFDWLQHYFPIYPPAARSQETPILVEPGSECQICTRKRGYLRDQRQVMFFRVHQLLCMPCEEITYNWQ